MIDRHLMPRPLDVVVQNRFTTKSRFSFTGSFCRDKLPTPRCTAMDSAGSEASRRGSLGFNVVECRDQQLNCGKEPDRELK